MPLALLRSGTLSEPHPVSIDHRRLYGLRHRFGNTILIGWLSQQSGLAQFNALVGRLWTAVSANLDLIRWNGEGRLLTDLFGGRR
jgi:hypothetical protein